MLVSAQLLAGLLSQKESHPDAECEKEKKVIAREAQASCSKKVLGGQKLAGREDGLRNKRKWEDAANARAMQRAFVCSAEVYSGLVASGTGSLTL